LRNFKLSNSEYLQKAAAALVSIEAQIDLWLQANTIDIDSMRSGDVLELAFPNLSKIVVNTQPPLQELWLAARSGGFHFKLQNGEWRDTRNGQDFFEVLSACASEQASQPLQFLAPAGTN
jgi:CyaY protein